jgi:plasmid maintenance system antidote protein VapI
MSEPLTDIEVALRQLVASIGSQAGAARVLRISRSHLNHLLKRRKDFGPDLAKKLGFRRVVEFHRTRRSSA